MVKRKSMCCKSTCREGRIQFYVMISESSNYDPTPRKIFPAIESNFYKILPLVMHFFDTNLSTLNKKAHWKQLI